MAFTSGLESALDGVLGDEPLDLVRRIEHHTRTLDRNVRLTQMADAKAAPVLALQASLAAVAATQVNEIMTLFGDGRVLSAFSFLLLVVYVIGGAGGWMQAALVYLPRAPKPGLRARHGTSIVYFDDIQAMSFDEFAERSRHMRATELEIDLLRQVHVVAGIAAEKMRRVQLAFMASGIALSGWIALILLARI